MLAQLPSELLHHIIEPCDLDDLAHLASTCRGLRATLGRSNAVAWRSTFERQWGWLAPEMGELDDAPALWHAHTRLQSRSHVMLVGGSTSSPHSTGTGQPFTLSLPPVDGDPVEPGSRQALACARTSDGSIYAVGGWVQPPDEAEARALASCAVRRPAGARGESAEWSPLREEMSVTRAFPGAACVGGTAVMALGGGTSPWVGATCHASTELYRPESGAWVAGPEMLERRCGLAVAHVRCAGALYALGGYGGESAYHNSVEYLPLSGSGERGWLPGAPMRCCRSGHSASIGPDRRLYVCGGTSDGGEMLAEAEVLDTRTNRWLPLPPMPAGRGFHAALFDARGRLYAVGGDKTGAADDVDGRPDGPTPRAQSDSTPPAAAAGENGAAEAAAAEPLSHTELLGTPSRSVFTFDLAASTWRREADGELLLHDRANFAAVLDF